MSKLLNTKKDKHPRKGKNSENEKKPFSQLVPYYMTTGLKIKDLTYELD